MPRLIVLNGPPACGKSTIARRYVDEHPLALNLDVDHVRELLGRWRADPRTAGLVARDLAVAAARVHLGAGHDVVVPQLVAEPGFLDRLDRLAAETGAEYVEIVLTCERDESLRRYTQRWRAGADPVHGHAPEPDHDELAALYERLATFVATRPGAHTVPAADPDATYAYLLMTCLTRV